MQYGWSLDATKWRALLDAISTLELSFSRSRLEKLYASDIPRKPGVYLICTSAPGADDVFISELYTAIYVGKSDKSLRSRFHSHCSNKVRKLRQALGSQKRFHFWYSVVQSEYVQSMEGLLITCLGPPDNSQTASVRIPVTIGEGRPA